MSQFQFQYDINTISIFHKYVNLALSNRLKQRTKLLFFSFLCIIAACNKMIPKLLLFSSCESLERLPEEAVEVTTVNSFKRQPDRIRPNTV